MKPQSLSCKIRLIALDSAIFLLFIVSAWSLLMALAGEENGHIKVVYVLAALSILLLLFFGGWYALRHHIEAQRKLALKESEAKYRNFYENVQDVIYRTDYHGIITDISPSIEYHTGYRPEEFVGRHVQDFFYDPEEYAALDAAIEQNGVVNDFEIRLKNKDGRIVPTSVSSRIVFDSQGQAIATEGVLRDISTRKKMEASMQQQLWFLRALNEIAQIIIENDKPEKMLSETIRVVGETLKVDRALIYQVAFDSDHAIGLGEWINPRHENIESSKATFPLEFFLGAINEMRRSQQWLESHDDAIDPHLLEDGSAQLLHQHMHIKSLLWYPFAFQEQGYHVLVLNQISERRTWQKEEIDFVAATSRQVSIALEKIALLEETHRRAEEFAALYETSTTLSVEHDLNTLLNAIVERATALLKVPAGGMYLYDPTTRELEVVVASGSTIPLGTRLRLGEGMAGRVAQTQRPLRVEDYYSWTGRSHKYEGIPVRATLEVPILHGGELIGVLVVHEIGDSKKTFSDADEHLLSLFAAQAASAIRTARLVDEIRQHAAELEERVRDRTADLNLRVEEGARLNEAMRNLLEDLRAANRRAEETARNLEQANAELESFASSIAHDLRSPLRGIDGWSYILWEDYGKQLDEQAQEYLNRIRAEARRMSQMIDALLALAHLSRKDMLWESVDLSAMARTIAQRLQEEQPQRRVEFIIQQGLTTKGDLNLLEIALTNLIGNAFKFTSSRPLARIEFGQTEIEGQPTYFVRDNGVGFDMAYASQLFGAFQRLHAASEFPGTGIGLATVQRIIQRHGGRVWVTAEVDKGATFFFTLKERI
ncbi:MAG: GAF domain-containing protein [Chloroflexi bacterium]|nr:GAF domain-containing protein [Chloroflexota bacterium]